MHNVKIALKKFARPFQSLVHGKRAYRELKLLKFIKHENVCSVVVQFVYFYHNTQFFKIVGLFNVFTPTTTFEDFWDM